MASTPEHDTLICLFHHTDRAERTVQELLEIGLPENAITLIGRARMTADIDTGTASLDTLNVPEADRQRLSDGLKAGGSIVAVSTDGSMAGKIEAIFKEYSADKIDEKVMSSSDAETIGSGTSTVPNTYSNPPIGQVLLVSEPAAGFVGSPEMVTTEETLILLEPTDLVEETDLVEPLNGSTAASSTAGRFDPDAPIDNVRNPAADRLNDPLNRR